MANSDLSATWVRWRCSRVKELDPTITTVMGGANCEAQMGRALLDRFGFLDYVVSGEAEELVGDFFRDLLEQRHSTPYGVMSQKAARPVIAPRASVKDMRAVPIPDFDDYFRQMDHPACASRSSRPSRWRHRAAAGGAKNTTAPSAASTGRA